MATVLRVIGWGWVGLATLTLLIFGSVRLVRMVGGAGGADPFEMRYLEHPAIAAAHFVPGLLYLLLAPLQFSSRLRARHPSVHRANGWLLVCLAATSGLFAFVAALVLPAFAGLPTALATGVFGVLFLVCLFKAVSEARARRFARHREWMIRVFALALGVATIRLVIVAAEAATGLKMVDVFGFAFWAGFTINVAVAESWIRWTRRPRTS